MKKMIPVEIMEGRTNGMMISLMIFRFFTFSILAASIRALGIPRMDWRRRKIPSTSASWAGPRPYLVAESDFGNHQIVGNHGNGKWYEHSGMHDKIQDSLAPEIKYTKEYAANRLVTVLKMVTVAAIKKVFMVILKKGSLLNTWM